MKQNSNALIFFCIMLCGMFAAQGISAAGKNDSSLTMYYDAGSEEIIKVKAFNTPNIERKDTGASEGNAVNTADAVETGVASGTAGAVGGAVGVVKQSVQSRAEAVMRSLANAYPRRISACEFRNGDWAVKVRGQWFCYADGRLLPESQIGRAAEFSPQPFYPYPAVLPAWKRPTREEAKRLADAARRRQNGGAADRSLFFYDALWNIKSRDDAWEKVKSIKFLGKSIMVHPGIMEELALVEQKINRLAKSDPAVHRWLKELSSVSAWNWRNIADVKTRSNHAYGVAVDILPNQKLYRSLETYWLWAARTNPEWWNVSYSRRYHPPQAVISAFESYGFVWGGKWSFFDTMHFEYRPEILILSGMEVTGEY